MAEPSSLQRLVAIGGGLLLIRKGVATRGLLGLADILVGAAALYRGIAPARPRASVHQLHPCRWSSVCLRAGNWSARRAW